MRNLRSWERAHPGKTQRIEAILNHLHIADLDCNDTLTEAQARYLGRTLKAIWETKLELDSPTAHSSSTSTTSPIST